MEDILCLLIWFSCWNNKCY
uniref:Uncharacterized protein n=1 Tax=Rhizophora mucronata TaxID=61149 RepID=A0A2P2JT97_RHIMU